MVPRQILAGWRRRTGWLRATALLCAVGGLLAVTAPAGMAAPDAAPDATIEPATALIVGNDGALYSAESGTDGEWEEAKQASPKGIAPPGAAVATLRHAEGELDAYYVGSDGALLASRRTAAGQWQSPLRLSEPGLILPGCKIVVIVSGGVVHIIVIGRDGRVYVFHYVQQLWPPVFPLKPVVIGVTNLAIPCGWLGWTWLPHGLPGVFFVGAKGELNLVANDGADRWLEPRQISAEGVAPPGAGVAAISDDTGTSAFVVDEAGAPQQIFLPADGKDPEEPRPIAPDKIAPAGAALSVLRGPEGGLNLFYAGDDGAIYASRTDEQARWIEPTRLTDTSVVSPGSSLTPYVRGDRIDLVVNVRGRLFVWWCWWPWPWPWPLCPCPPPWDWYIPGEIFGPIRSAHLGLDGQIPQFANGVLG